MTREEKAFWEKWEPTSRTVLCFILRGEEVLLIRKKRGLGAGKINGPGGHLESGESARDAAIREVQEELNVTPYGLQEMGELYFQFVDQRAKKFFSAEKKEDPFKEHFSNENFSDAQHCVVFIAAGCIGEPQETKEAIPYWSHYSQIPFEEMWADDREWMPGMLAPFFQNKSSQYHSCAANVDAALLQSSCKNLPTSLSAQHGCDEMPELGSKNFRGYYFFDHNDVVLSGHLEWLVGC